MKNDIILTIEHKGNTQELGFHNLDNLASADTFLVVGPGYYGYGVSLAAARKNCVSAGCKPGAKKLAYLGDSTLGVTGVGTVVAEKVLVCLGEI